MKKALILFLLLSSLYFLGCSSSSSLISEDEMGFKHKIVNKDVTVSVSMKYLLYVPKEYNGRTEYPLVIFLHGSGERGNNLEKVKKHGIPKEIANGKTFPFIMVAPQCKDEEQWNSYELNALYEQIIKDYKVDLDKVYLTGLSMGGYGTWKFASEYPERFAALIPVCGGGNPDAVDDLKDVPIWAFHGGKDKVVPLQEADTLVNKLKSLGSKIKFTVYPEAGHDSWTATYSNPDVYKWMLSQKRKTK